MKKLQSNRDKDTSTQTKIQIQTDGQTGLNRQTGSDRQSVLSSTLMENESLRYVKYAMKRNTSMVALLL